MTLRPLPALAILAALGCVPVRPNPDPRPTPTPPVINPVDCLPGSHLDGGACVPDAPKPKTGCPAGVPPPGRYDLDQRPKANGDVFWSLTPKVISSEYCASNPDPRAKVVCPYAPEGDPRRGVLEKACAYPDVVEGAEMRADGTFTADSPAGAHVRFCRGDVCVEGAAR